MKMEPIKILKATAKFTYVNVYKKWKYKICEIIGVIPIKHFWVEMIIQIDNVEMVDVGYVIRFDDFTQARITSINKETNTFICDYNEISPRTYFQFNSSYFYLMFRVFSEK